MWSCSWPRHTNKLNGKCRYSFNHSPSRHYVLSGQLHVPAVLLPEEQSQVLMSTICLCSTSKPDPWSPQPPAGSKITQFYNIARSNSSKINAERMSRSCNTHTKDPSDLVVASCNTAEIRQYFGGTWKNGKVPVHTMKAYSGRRRIVPLILDPDPRCSEWSALSPSHVNPGKDPCIQWVGVAEVGRRAGLDVPGKEKNCRDSNSGPSSR